MPRSAGGEVSGIVDWLEGAARAAAYPGLALLSFVENMFPPLSSMVILPMAGFLVGRGELGYVAVVTVTTLGSTLGATVLYTAGRRLGRGPAQRLAEGGRFRFGAEQLDRADRWFRRYGAAAVLLGRLAPVIRSLVSIPAGMARMSRPTFVGYTAAGNLCWNAALVAAGWVLGENWRQVRRYGDVLTYGVGAVLLLIVLRVAWTRWRRGTEDGSR